jgi:plastocyanin
MTMRPVVVFLAAVAALTLAGAAGARAGATRAVTVHVTAKDFSFTLSPKKVKHGRITFVIVNRGHAAHDFAIAGHTSKTIGPGKTTRLTVTLARGAHPYKCTVDSHAELGMKGVLHVT